jgi:hypothetical protein
MSRRKPVNKPDHSAARAPAPASGGDEPPRPRGQFDPKRLRLHLARTYHFPVALAGRLREDLVPLYQ